jgi:hypothetical protein
MNSQSLFFQIFLRTLCGNTITLDVEPADSIVAVKDRIFNKTGTPAQHQRLAFAGKQLQDSCSLRDYGIGRDCTLHLSGRLLGGMRLYHCTSASNADSIRRSGFRCGSGGLAGGGIYFAESVSDASRKAHAQGVVLECEVDLGRMMHLSHSGDSSLNLHSVKSRGYDSVCIPRSGTEYCVYEPHRVRVLSQHADPAATSASSYTHYGSVAQQSQPTQTQALSQLAQSLYDLASALEGSNVRISFGGGYTGASPFGALLPDRSGFYY